MKDLDNYEDTFLDKEDYEKLSDEEKREAKKYFHKFFDSVGYNSTQNESDFENW